MHLSSPERIRVVCLAVPSGAASALIAFITRLAPDNGAAYLVVPQPSAGGEEDVSPSSLERCTAMPVLQLEDGAALRPDHIYLSPAGMRVQLVESRLRAALDKTAAAEPNASFDYLLRCVAETSGVDTIAVMLSSGDAIAGMKRVKEAGGFVLAQRQSAAPLQGSSATQWASIVDVEGTPEELAVRVQQLLACPPPPPSQQLEREAIQLKEIFDLLAQVGPDLSYLRRTMVLRRVHRRMTIVGHTELPQYLSLLRAEQAERSRLRADLLIGVTRFFRDPEAFEALTTTALRDLLKNSPAEEPLRVWVTACSTGQEVYTVVMLLLETMQQLALQRELKVFATDLDEQALERASRGSYNASEVAEIKPELLSRYFHCVDGRYWVRAPLREPVIFARHNLVVDPPFGKIDFVTCRNVLIYLRPEVQQQVLGALQSALKPVTGVLMLGAAERVGQLHDTLEVLDKRAKIYRRSAAPLRRLRGLTLREPDTRNRIAQQLSLAQTRSDEQTRLLRAVLEVGFEIDERSAALIDHDGRLVDVLTDPLTVFRFPKGRPTDDLARVLPGRLASAALTATQRLNQDCLQAQLLVPMEDGTTLQLAVRQVPPDIDRPPRRLLLIQQRQQLIVDDMPTDFRQQAEAMERELRDTRESLQATIEELESANEEQQATNEELVASNEALQSANEELQSVNQELQMVNTDHRKRNVELATVSADLDNLLQSISVATLFLDTALCVQRFTPGVVRLIPLQDSDIGRPIAELVGAIELDIVRLAKDVLNRGITAERELRDRDGAWLLMRAQRYRRAERLTDGVLITLVEVTRIKNAEEMARVVSEELAERNAQLADQAGQLEDLLSIVAHDLKRPMLGVDGMLKLADSSLRAGSLDKTRDYMDGALESLGGLHSVLGDLTRLSKQARTEPVCETVLVHVWLDELLQPFVDQAKQREVRLNWACDGHTAHFARSAAAGALTNLVENAFVHGTSDDNPRIDVLCQVTDTVIRMVVSDNGRGIAPDDHERVFELFRRLHPQEAPGTGVGLVSVRRQVRRAGGNVRLESALGRGAKFIIELPNEGREVETTGPAQAGAARSVLLVDDDAVDAKRVRLLLRGHDVMQAGTLAEAKQLVLQRRYDLVVLDLSLPDGHGLGLFSTLRNSPNTATPIILMSGHLDGLRPEAMLGSNVVAAFVKDRTDDATLRRTIEEYANL